MSYILSFAFIVLPVTPALSALSLILLLFFNKSGLKHNNSFQPLEKRLWYIFVILSIGMSVFYLHPEKHLAGLLTHYLIVALLLLLFIQQTKKDNDLSLYLIYSSLILSFIGLGNYLLAWTYRLQLFRIPFYDQPFLIDIYLMYHFGRARSFAMHPNILGIILAMTLPLLLWAIGKGQTTLTKTFFGLCLLAQLTCIVFTFSRASWIAGAVGICLYIYLRGGFKQLKLLVISVIILCLLLIIFMPDHVLPIVDRIKTLVDPGFHSNQQRWFIWSEGFNLLMTSPLSGIGILNFENHYAHQASIPAAHLHNLLFQTLLESGLVAGLIIMGLIFALLKPGIPLKTLDPIYQACWAGLISFLCGSLFDYTLVDFRVVLFFSALLAIWLHHRLAIKAKQTNI